MKKWLDYMSLLPQKDHHTSVVPNSHLLDKLNKPDKRAENCQNDVLIGNKKNLLKRKEKKSPLPDKTVYLGMVEKEKLSNETTEL